MLEQILKPVAASMEAYRAHLEAMFAGASDELRPMTAHVLQSRGKAIRPLLVMLCAGLFEDSARKRERSLVGATMIEVVHSASLVHDDVIDGAALRRSLPTLNALWGNHAAILAGDYILSRGFAQGLESGHWDIVTLVNRSLAAVCEGEMLQSRQSELLGMTREVYYHIITRKTALLLSTAARLGAMAADAPREQIEALGEYGRLLGMAFQMGDDILDYAPAAQTGKSAAADIRERKINLPMLLLLETSSQADRSALLEKLAAAGERPEYVDELAAAVAASEAMPRARELMGRFAADAARMLELFPESDCRASLEGLCDYVCARER